jgi:hypothetical protein
MASVLMVRLMRKSGPLSEDGGDEELFEHKAISRALAALDQAATEAGMAPLSGFVSEDPENVLDAVDDEDEAEELLAKLPPVRWFDPAKALPSIAAVLARVDGGAVEGMKNPAKVAAELRDLQAILKTAIAKRATFRFFHEF